MIGNTESSPKAPKMRSFCGIFPWVYTSHPIQLKKLLFKGLAIDERIEESKQKQRYLSKIISMFRQGNGKPIESATYFFVRFPQKDFDIWDRGIREDILLFSYIALRSMPHQFYHDFEQANSYYFDLLRWDDWLSDKTFNIVTVNLCPRPVNAEQIFTPNDAEIVNEKIKMHEDTLSNAIIALSRGQIESVSNTERERIIRAISWFLGSGIGCSPNALETSIVSLGTAFEVLFDITGFERKVEALKVAMTSLLGDDDAGSLRKWVNNFYEERSKAVHLGWSPDTTFVPPKKYSQTEMGGGRYIVGGYEIFDVCLQKILANRGPDAKQLKDRIKRYLIM